MSGKGPSLFFSQSFENKDLGRGGTKTPKQTQEQLSTSQYVSTNLNIALPDNWCSCPQIRAVAEQHLYCFLDSHHQSSYIQEGKKASLVFAVCQLDPHLKPSINAIAADPAWNRTNYVLIASESIKLYPRTANSGARNKSRCHVQTHQNL